jgi:DNA primase
MSPPHLDFQSLKQAVSVERVLADRGLLARLRPRGPAWVGPCPLHGGDNPNAFVVHRQRNLWRCFTRCNSGGDVVALVRRLDGTDYRATAVYLARLAGSTPPLHLPTPTPLARTFRSFTRALPLDHDAPFLARKGIRSSTAARFEVGAFTGRGMLDGCIAVRLHDPDGRPLGYAGRRLDPQSVERRGKWVFPPALPRSRILYGYHRAHTRHISGLLVVECPWAVLRLAQLGLPAIALLGTHLSEAQHALLAPLPRIILMMDGDSAGQAAAARIRERRPDATIITLNDNRDPDDLTDRELLDRIPLPS